MNPTQADTDMVFAWLRARTVDAPGHPIPRYIVLGIMRQWARDCGFTATPSTATITTILSRAGFPTEYVGGTRVVRNLNLLPKESGQR